MWQWSIAAGTNRPADSMATTVKQPDVVTIDGTTSRAKKVLFFERVLRERNEYEN